MDIPLRGPVALYFTSENAHDPSAIERCFAAGAIVRNEGKTIKGTAAIQAWRIETAQKYHHAVEPLAVSARDGKVVVAAKVSGAFPGSPIRLEHIFEIEGDRISSLEIRS
jgi:hypothetical protein